MLLPRSLPEPVQAGAILPLVDDTPLCIAGNVIDRQPQNGGNGSGVIEDLAYTITATDRHAVFARQRIDVFRKMM